MSDAVIFEPTDASQAKPIRWPGAGLARGRSSSGPSRLGLGKPVPYGLAVGPLAILATWSLVTATGWASPQFLPAPWAVVDKAIDLIHSGTLQKHLIASLGRAYTAFAIGILMGWVLGIVAGIGRSGEYLIDGPVQIWRTIPDLALIPLFILWFGIGEDMKIIMVTMSIFTPVYINTYRGVRSVETRYVELAETLKLTKWAFIRHIVIPGSLGGFFTGLRLAATLAMVSLVVVEQVNASSGLGYLMTSARRNGDVDIIFVGLIVYAFIGFATYSAVVILERRVLRWSLSLGRTRNR